MKINLIKQIKETVVKTSDNNFHKKNFEILRNLFISNSHPLPLVNRILFNTTTSPPQNIRNDITDTTQALQTKFKTRN